MEYVTYFLRDNYARNILEGKSTNNAPGINLHQNFIFAHTPSFSPRKIFSLEPRIQY